MKKYADQNRAFRRHPLALGSFILAILILAVLLFSWLPTGIMQARAVTVEYTITYQPGEGSSLSGYVTNTVVHDDSNLDYPGFTVINLPAEFTAPDGKGFKHWYTDATPSFPNYDPGDKFTEPGDITFLAIWDNLYTMSFVANGGTGTMADETRLNGSQFYMPECTFTPPDGMRFRYWSVRRESDPADSGTPMLPVTDFWGMNENAVATAIWESATDISYRVTLEADNGLGEVHVIDIPVAAAGDEVSYTLPGIGTTTITVPAGKQFSGWDLSGTTYQPGDTLTLTGDATVTALWEDVIPVQRTLTFIGPEVTDVDTITIADGSNYYIRPTDAERFTAPAGKHFAGWKLGAQGTTVYPVGDVIEINRDLTFVAVYEDDAVTPVDPANPTNPTTPANPATPTTPSNPSSGNTNAQNNTNAATNEPMIEVLRVDNNTGSGQGISVLLSQPLQSATPARNPVRVDIDNDTVAGFFFAQGSDRLIVPQSYGVQLAPGTHSVRITFGDGTIISRRFELGTESADRAAATTPVVNAEETGQVTQQNAQTPSVSGDMNSVNTPQTSDPGLARYAWLVAMLSAAVLCFDALILFGNPAGKKKRG